MSHHDLKTLPAPFALTLAGRKPFEIRREDQPGGERTFAVGDTATLREWSPCDGCGGGGKCAGMDCSLCRRRGGRYTGRQLGPFTLTHVARGTWGLPPGLVVFALVVEAADRLAQVSPYYSVAQSPTWSA